MIRLSWIGYAHYAGIVNIIICIMWWNGGFQFIDLIYMKSNIIQLHFLCMIQTRSLELICSLYAVPTVWWVDESRIHITRMLSPDIVHFVDWIPSIYQCFFFLTILSRSLGNFIFYDLHEMFSTHSIQIFRFTIFHILWAVQCLCFFSSKLKYIFLFMMILCGTWYNF